MADFGASVSKDPLVNPLKCKEIPSGEEPVGINTTFGDILPTFVSISDKNQTKAEMYQDHIFNRDDQTDNQIDTSIPFAPANESLSNEYLSIDDGCRNQCQNGCLCAKITGTDRYECINEPGRAFLGDKCEYSEPILSCGIDNIGIIFPAYEHYITDWRQDGFLHLGDNTSNPACRFTNASETLVTYDHWQDCDGNLEFIPESNLPGPQGSILIVKNKVKRDIDDLDFTYDSTIFEWECRYHLDVEPLYFETSLPGITDINGHRTTEVFISEIGTIHAQMTFYKQGK